MLEKVTSCICNSCRKVILDESKGFIIQGNIYVARTEDRGGIIGNNFPNKSKFSIDEVHEVCYCANCLKTMLKI